MKKNKKNKSSSLKKRMEKSFDSRDSGGGNRITCFDWKKSKEKIKFFTPNTEDKGKNLISIVSYPIKTKNDPLVKAKEAAIGDLCYVLEYYTHVSPFTKAEILCTKSTYNRPCKICDAQSELFNKGKKKEAAELKAKRKVAYNVFDHNHPENGIQVFQVSQFLFEKELIEESRSQYDGDDDGFIDFTDNDDGKAIVFRAKKVSKSFGEGQAPAKFIEFKGFSFPDREETLDEDIISKAVSFDEFLKIPTEEDIENIFYGDDKGDDEDDEETDDEESDDEDEDDDLPAKASGKGNKKPNKSKSKSDDEDDDESDDDEEEDDEDSDNDSESDDEEDDSDEDEEDEEDEKPVKSSKGKSSSKKVKEGECPFGHKFGKDTDKEKYEEDCDECDNYKECKIAFKKAQGKK